MRRILEIFKYCWRFLYTKIAPNRYAKKLLGYLGEGCQFYGVKPHMFGSEPWMISIGAHTEIAANCQFITHDGAVNVLRDRVPDLEVVEPIEIGERCFIGLDTILMGPTKVGNGCIIGARSFVKGEFPDNSVIAGSPARVICTVEEYLSKTEKRSTHTGELRGKARELALKSIKGITV